MRTFTSTLALTVAATGAARAGVSQIDIKLRPWGSVGPWSDTLSLQSTGNDPIDVECGVFYRLGAGYGLYGAIHNVVGSPYYPTLGDLVSLFDRPDSNVHPDGRVGNFNFTTHSAYGQTVYNTGTSGVDHDRFRIGSMGNPTDLPGGGIHLAQDSPPNMGTSFDASNPAYGYHFRLTLACYNGGASRTVTIDAPVNKIAQYSAYVSATSTQGTGLIPTLLPTDTAAVTVSWIPAPPAAFSFSLGMFALAQRRRQR